MTVTDSAVRGHTGSSGGTGLPVIESPSRVPAKDARALTKQFLARLDELEEGTDAYQYVRNTLIEMNLSLVRYAASRFSTRPEDLEDVVQVGTIGLIKAIERFQVSREVAFTTFAVPCIVGEIRRFFRDTTWAVHVPRRLQEAREQLARADEELRSRLDREPTVAELAVLMSLPESEVVEARKAANGYTTTSLDAAVAGGADEGGRALADCIGGPDPAFELVEDFQTLAPLIAELDERDRILLHHRFVDELTQAEIGERLGVSQMHVSRLLSRLLTRLRAAMTQQDRPGARSGPAAGARSAPSEPVPCPASDTAPASGDRDGSSSGTAGRPDAEPEDQELLGLRQAHERLLPGISLAALRWARANDERFPAAAGKRGAELLYRAAELTRWAESRPHAPVPRAAAAAGSAPGCRTA